MLPALGSIASQQANLTERTMLKSKQLLDYAATHPDAIITYRASDMVLAGHSDASYIYKSISRSKSGGHYFMTDESVNPPNNGAVITISKIIKPVMSFAAESEICALFVNSRGAIPELTVQEEMGNKQPPTPMQTEQLCCLFAWALAVSCVPSLLGQFVLELIHVS